MDSRIEVLTNALRQGDRARQRQAVETMLQAGAEIIEPVVAALEPGNDPFLRRGAAFACAHLRDPRLVPLLIAALADVTDDALRLYAAQALAVQQDARAVEPLILALQGDQAALCEEAARALGEIGDEFKSQRIIEALAGALNHADWGTRQSAAEMLIRLEWENWQQAEESLLADLSDGDSEMRLGAAASLVELADGRALEPLVELLNHTDLRIASNAALMLGKLGDQRAVVPLSAALTHASESMRKAARQALRQLHVQP